MNRTKSWSSEPRTYEQIRGQMGFMGWSTEQWAIAAGRYPEAALKDAEGRVYFKDARELKTIWDKYNYADPGESMLVGVDLPRDWNWSFAMARDATTFASPPTAPKVADLKPKKWKLYGQ